MCLLPRDGYVNVGMNPILVGWGKLASQKGNKITYNSMKQSVFVRKLKILKFYRSEHL